MQIGKLYIGKYPERLKEIERSTEKLRAKLEKVELERDVLKEERDEAADVLRLKLQLKADELALDVRDKYLDKREDYLGKLAETMKWDKAHPTVDKPEVEVEYIPTLRHL